MFISPKTRFFLEKHVFVQLYNTFKKSMSGQPAWNYMTIIYEEFHKSIVRCSYHRLSSSMENRKILLQIMLTEKDIM